MNCKFLNNLRLNRPNPENHSNSFSNYQRNYDFSSFDLYHMRMKVLKSRIHSFFGNMGFGSRLKRKLAEGVENRKRREEERKYWLE